MRFNWYLLILFCLLTGCLGGCSGIFASDVRPNSLTQTWTDTQRTELLGKYKSPGLLNRYDALPPEQRAEFRDQTFREMQFLIDYDYSAFVNNLRVHNANVNFMGDLAVIGMSTIAAVTGTAEVKATLAAITAGLTGAKSSYSTEYLKNQSISSIINQMDVNRGMALQTILSRLGYSAAAPRVVTPDKDYSLRELLVDLQAYDNAGSVAEAILNLEKVTSAQAVILGDSNRLLLKRK